MSYLKSIKACNAGANWADSKNSYREAWDECERGDWMLWIAKKQGVDLRVLTRAKVECAKLVEHLMKDERSINALRVAEKFADGNATRYELSAAAYAAYAAADAVDDYAAAAAYAADAAAADAAAADAADAAAHSAAADDYAAAAAAYADAYAADAAAAHSAAAAAAAAAHSAAAAARRDTLKICADICRKYIKFEDLGIK